MSLNVDNLRQCGIMVLLAVMLHNSLGLTTGYFLARFLKCDRKTAVTIAIEVGMQNSGLAASLASTAFPHMAMAAVPGAIFSVWHNISGAILTAIFRPRPRAAVGDNSR